MIKEFEPKSLIQITNPEQSYGFGPRDPKDRTYPTTQEDQNWYIKMYIWRCKNFLTEILKMEYELNPENHWSN